MMRWLAFAFVVAMVGIIAVGARRLIRLADGRYEWRPFLQQRPVRYEAPEPFRLGRLVLMLVLFVLAVWATQRWNRSVMNPFPSHFSTRHSF